MEEINNLYQDVQDIESIIFDFNKIKTHITFLENETASLKMKLDPDFKQSLELKIDHLEQEYKKIENEIKRIDLSSKDCYTISEIKALFEILNDKKVIMEKCISFTNSLIYDLSISSETFAKISLKNECKYGTYKVLKISKDINEFFLFLKDEYYFDCFKRIKDILFEEMYDILVCDFEIFDDNSYYYFFWFFNDKQISIDLKYFNSINPVDLEILKKTQIGDIFLEIFKSNLNLRLLTNKLEKTNFIATNNFLKNSEFFIINENEWKLDCVMKEIIRLSKSKKSNNLVKIEEESNYLPKYISEELHKFNICLKVFESINSKRITKAKKLIDRALLKLLTHEDYFVLFADVSFSIQKFNLSALLEIKENTFMDIVRKSTVIEKSLQENSLILKVYFKEKHFDFLESLKVYVPKNCYVLFETTFFNLIYTNVVNNILCMTFLENEKIRELSDSLKYLIEMSYNISKENILSFKRINSVYIILTNDLGKISEIYLSRKLYLDNTEVIILINLIFKESKAKKLLIYRIEQDIG